MRFRGGIAKKVGGIGALVVIVNQSVTFFKGGTFKKYFQKRGWYPLKSPVQFCAFSPKGAKAPAAAKANQTVYNKISVLPIFRAK